MIPTIYIQASHCGQSRTVMYSVIRFSAILFAALSVLTLGSCSDDKETGPVAVSIAGLPDDLAHPLSRQQRPAAQLMIGATGQGLVAFDAQGERSEEHTSELQSLMRTSYAVFCLKKKIKAKRPTTTY